MAEIKPEIETFAKIKVVGVGGSGGSAVNHMIDLGIKGVEFIAINTDIQALHANKASKKLHIGKGVTRGLGAGMNPELGRQAAEESQNEIREVLKDANMVFVTCGMGGGTGTGASPIVAEISRDLGALTIAVVTKPFAFEGNQRKNLADRGMMELTDKVDAIITIPNDRIFQIIDKKASLLESFSKVDDVLRQGVQGIAELITVPGRINVDFADVKAVMSNSGSALMGIGQATGENRAIEAAKLAINSPLLEMSIDGARGILFTIQGGSNLGMGEVQEAAKIITASADEDAKIIFGIITNEKMKDEVKITVVATGFDQGTPGRRVETYSGSMGGHPYIPNPVVASGQQSQISTPVSATNSMSHSTPENNNYVSPSRPKISPVKAAQAEPARRKDSYETDEEDDLGIPAFIRKKMM
ncbi:MAG: cell division protein FtsZ [bacterium]